MLFYDRQFPGSNARVGFDVDEVDANRQGMCGNINVILPRFLQRIQQRIDTPTAGIIERYPRSGLAVYAVTKPTLPMRYGGRKRCAMTQRIVRQFLNLGWFNIDISIDVEVFATPFAPDDKIMFGGIN
jgi:hypothetical protein